MTDSFCSPFIFWPLKGWCGVNWGTYLGWSHTLVSVSLCDLHVLNPPTSLLLYQYHASASDQSILPKLVHRSVHRSHKRRTVQEWWQDCSKMHQSPCYSSPPFAVWTFESITSSLVLSMSPDVVTQSYQDLGREDRTQHLDSIDILLILLYFSISCISI